MAETYRILYDNQAWIDDLGAITQDTDADSPAGYKVEKAFDGSLTTVWTVEVQTSPQTSFWAKIDRGAAITARSKNQGLAILNHNLFTAGCASITIEDSTNDSVWTGRILALAVPTDDNDLMIDFGSGNESTARYVRITFAFDSAGMDADANIGQIYFGYVEDFPKPPASLGGNFSMETTAASVQNVGGTVYAVSRGSRRQPYALEVAVTSFTDRATVRNWWSVQKGPVYPFVLHSGEHDGTTDSAGAAWASISDSGGTWANDANGGGAWMMSFASDAFPQSYPVGGSYILGLPMVRHMTATEV